MKMDIIAGSKNNEYYTPEYAIRPLLKYLPSCTPPHKGSIVIWCPFDTEDSLYVKIFREQGYTVIPTHIKNGQDFFTIQPPKCDYIISNPPYSCKTEVLEKLFSLGIPFAMLVGVVGLFESKRRFCMFRDNKFEIMYFDKRVWYFKDYENQGVITNPPFSSAYICSNILPQQIVFEELER